MDGGLEVPSCEERCDVLILGSLPGPFALFSRRAVDEKLDVDAGARVAAHCVAGVRKMAAAALKGRKTGRKDERFMVVGGGGVVARALMACRICGLVVNVNVCQAHMTGARAEFTRRTSTCACIVVLSSKL